MKEVCFRQAQIANLEFLMLDPSPMLDSKYSKIIYQVVHEIRPAQIASPGFLT